MDTAHRLLTYEDLFDLPDGMHAEIVHGALIVHPSPLPRHGRAQGALSRAVGGPFDADDGRGGPGGWWILPEVDVRLDRHLIVRPDLAGWRRERLPSPWDTRPIDVVPDWVCEILSPSNPAHDRVTKKREYARFGVPFYWIIDPHARTLEAHALRDGVWVDAGTFDDTGVGRIAPFEAVELEVGLLFPPRESEPTPDAHGP